MAIHMAEQRLSRAKTLPKGKGRDKTIETAEKDLKRLKALRVNLVQEVPHVKST